MRNQPRNIRPTEALVDLLARRPELRDVGIAGYLAGAAVEGAPGMPPKAWRVAARFEARCIGVCLSGHDIGLPFGDIAYPHPDCPKHGADWVPFDNDWSREYVAAHPERFGGAA